MRSGVIHRGKVHTAMVLANDTVRAALRAGSHGSVLAGLCAAGHAKNRGPEIVLRGWQTFGAVFDGVPRLRRVTVSQPSAAASCHNLSTAGTPTLRWSPAPTAGMWSNMQFAPWLQVPRWYSMHIDPR